MTREEQISRLRAAYEFWSKFRDGSPWQPYMHPSDLFDLDPLVKKPHYVPMGFIPEKVGGVITVVNRTQSRLRQMDTETKEFVMSNFLPGGYKKRWEFKHWRALWEPSENTRQAANVERTFEFGRSVPLDTILHRNTFSPLELSTDQTTVYFPETVYIEEIQNYGRFFWNDTIHLLTTARDDGTTHDLTRDPLSTPLFETVPISTLSNRDRTACMIPSVETPGRSIIRSVSFLSDFRIVRCYYANCLHLFPRGQPLTRIVTFYHDPDRKYAVIGTEHISQAVIFSLDIDPLMTSAKEVIEDDPILKNDLRFRFLKVLLHRSLLREDHFLESIYDVDWVFGILMAVDHWLVRENAGHDLRHFFEVSDEEQSRILTQLIPSGTETRLRLAGYSVERKDEFVELLKTHGDRLCALLTAAHDETEFDKFLREVLANTLEKAIQVWSQRVFSVVGEGLTFWQTGVDDSGVLHVYAYDSYQGGTGIAHEFFGKLASLVKEGSIDLNENLRLALQCEVDISDAVIHAIFRKYDTHFISGVFTADGQTQEQVILNAIREEEKARKTVIREKVKDDITAFVKLDCKRLTSSSDLIALYHALVAGYAELLSLLQRTPTIIDLLLYSSANRFYDPRATQAFEYFRTMKKGDLSEIYVRVSEILPACTNACPECIDIEDFYGNHMNQSDLLDKRLLRKVLEKVS